MTRKDRLNNGKEIARQIAIRSTYSRQRMEISPVDESDYVLYLCEGNKS